MVIERTGVEPTAEIFLEPPPGDCFEKDFTININYEDGQAGNVNTKATSHTDAKLAVDPKAPGGIRPDAWVYLTDDEMLFGKLDGIGPETLRFTTPGKTRSRFRSRGSPACTSACSIARSRASRFRSGSNHEGPKTCCWRRPRPARCWLSPGVVEGTDAEKLRFRYQDKTRTISLKQVEGVIMASRPESRQPEELRPTFTLPDSVVDLGKVERPRHQHLEDRHQMGARAQSAGE